MPHLAFFEDDLARRFLPMSWTRPVFELRCGAWTLREAAEQHAFVLWQMGVEG